MLKANLPKRLTSMISFTMIALICTLIGSLQIRMIYGPFGSTFSMISLVIINAITTFLLLLMVELSLNLHLNIYKWKIKSKLSLSFWSFVYFVVNLKLVMVATLVPFLTGEMEFYALYQVFSGKAKSSIETPM